MTFSSSMPFLASFQIVVAVAVALATGVRLAPDAASREGSSPAGSAPRAPAVEDPEAPDPTDEREQATAPPPAPVLLGPPGLRVELDRPCTLRYVLGLAGGPGGVADAESLPGAFASHPVHSHFVLGEAFRLNGDALSPMDPADAVLIWTFERDGLHRVGVTSRPAPRWIDAASLRELWRRSRGLDEEALVAVARTASDAGRDRGAVERRLGLDGEGARLVQEIVQADALIAVGDDHGSAALRKLGRPVEIRLLLAPAAVGAGGELPVRLYVEGEAVAAAVVRASGPQGALVHAHSDPTGHAVLKLGTEGRWCVQFEHLRGGDTADAPLQWFRATTSLWVPAAEPPQGGEASGLRTNEGGAR